MKELKQFYREMLLLRKFDLLTRSLKMKDIVYSGYHPTEGQEAIAVGFCGALEKEDVLLSTHRPHAHAVAKGCTMERVLTEMMGRETGCSGGLGGAMQFLEPEENFYCGSIVGSNICLATGFGMAIKQKKLDQVCMCMFGDGASNHGSFHEGLNLAAIWKLPVIFVCENNQFAEAMPVKEFVSCERISSRAKGYGLEEITVDGNDVEQSRAAAEAAIEKCKKGEGPVFIEAVTYRIQGHYIGDPEKTYRDRAEVREARKREPLVRAKEQLLSSGVDADELKAMGREIDEQLETLEEWALKQEFPSLEAGIDHVGIAIEDHPEVRCPQSLKL